MKMLMDIDPLPMRGSIVMTMVTISPSRRDVSPAEQLHRSPRLVPPRFCLVAVEFRHVSLLTIFSSTKVSFGIYKKYRAKKAPEEGHPPSTRVGASPPASWATWQPPDAYLLV